MSDIDVVDLSDDEEKSAKPRYTRCNFCPDPGLLPINGVSGILIYIYSGV